MHWGIYEVEARPGQLPLLRGLSTDPDPSPIGLDMLDASVSRLRVRRPAIRRGWLENGPGPTTRRGHDAFVEVDWDTALANVASEIARVRSAHGNGAIFGGSYGWSSAGRFHHARANWIVSTMWQAATSAASTATAWAPGGPCSYRLDDCPGHAVWREPTEWLGDAAASRYPLHLLSDQPARRLHSQLDHSPYSRAGKVAGREPVYLNPEDAAARGICNGDVVELFNDRGRCLAGAIVTPDIMQGVARLATGAWFDPDGGTEKHGNPNALTLDRGASAFSQGCAAQSCLVEAQRLDTFAPTVTAYVLPPGIADCSVGDP